jgi:hypothetical protein
VTAGLLVCCASAIPPQEMEANMTAAR